MEGIATDRYNKLSTGDKLKIDALLAMLVPYSEAEIDLALRLNRIREK